MTVYEQALNLLEHGISFIPVAANDKTPAFEYLENKSWMEYKKRIPTLDETERWFKDSKNSIAIVGGQVSGNLEIIDFDKIEGISFKDFEGKLNKDNFDELAEIILSICSRERPKIEKKVFANERQRDIWEKLQEGRKRNAKKNELKLEDALNICEFGGKYHIPIEEILKWSLWRIINCYKSIMGISGYENSFSIFLVSGDKKLIENKHWTELIKLNYKHQEY